MFTPGFVYYQKRCIRLIAASDKVYQLRAHGRWFSPGTTGSSTTKTSRHYRAEILVKVAISTINQVKSSNENEVKYIELRRIIVINEMNKLMRN